MSAAEPHDIESPADVPPEERFDNRELSWLDFDERVLALAENPDLPILERVRFLAIYNANLDEFYQIRVAGLKEQVNAGIPSTSPDGMAPDEQLARIGARVKGLSSRQHRVWSRSIKPRLRKAGIRIEDWDDLDDAARLFLREVYEERLYPILTPLSVDPSHPFPYISNLSLNLALMVRPPGSGMARFARVKVPPSLPRLLGLPDGERFVFVEQVIAAYIEDLFPGHGDRRHVPVPGDPRRRHRARDRRGRGPAEPDRVDPPAARALARGRPARGPAVDAEGDARPPARGALARRPRRRRLAVAARARRPRAAHDARPPRPAVRAVVAADAAPDSSRSWPDAPTSSPCSAPATCSCTTPTTRSTRRSSCSWNRPPAIRR